MGRKYGGRYSPPGMGDDQGDTGARFRGRKATNFRIGARLMYAAPLPMLLAGIGEVMAGDATGMLVELGSFALLLLSAILVNEGLKAEDAYNARTIARPPIFPRKAAAIAATTLGVVLAGGAGGSGLVGGLVFGAVAGAAQYLAFGLDPMKRKGIEGIDAFETDRAARAIDRAEQTVSEILAAARTIGDRHMEARVERMTAAVRDVFRVVEEDPRDLSRARKFLGVYLVGARDATRKFADVYSRAQNQEARADYLALLDDMEASFKAHREDLLKDDKVALDVEIEVLRERLQREGV